MENIDYKSLTAVGDGDLDRIVNILSEQWKFEKEEIEKIVYHFESFDVSDHYLYMMDGNGNDLAKDNWENWCENSYFLEGSEDVEVNPFD